MDKARETWLPQDGLSGPWGLGLGCGFHGSHDGEVGVVGERFPAVVTFVDTREWGCHREGL